MKKVFFYSLLAVGLLTKLNAQTYKLDSLKQQLSITKVDSVKVQLLNDIAFGNININPIVAKDDVLIAYEKAKRISYNHGIARSLVVMGGVYWGFGNYEQALAHYLDALKEYQKLDDIKGRSDCLNNIGEVYKKLGEYNNSLDYLKHSLALKEKITTDNVPALSYNNLGEVYTLMGDYEKALENYDIAIAAAKKQNDKRVLAYATDGYGTLYLAKKDYSKAVPYFNEAAILRKSMNDFRGLAYTYTNLGRCYFNQSQLDSALYYYKAGISASKKSSAADVRANLYQLISKVDSLKGDFKGAYYHYMRHDQLKDSIFNIEKSTQIARMQAEYENEILRKENETKEAQVSERNTLIIAVIMLLILTLALANAFYNQRTVQKKANKSLSQKNEQIERQNLEIQTQAIKLRDLNDNLENLNQNLEAKIRSRTEELQKSNKELADYAFIHAHELRAPVANILGLVQLLRHAQMNPKDHDMVEHLYSATEQLDKVIQGIVNKEQQKNA
ncbi:MAG: tetratricopeptide repeat protein [Fulvivirga sp.]|uniref:tetratricopeptide repeat protein n=1 Tax=Fulvivirga sp. TaxID=1931237 RepID=UPI0032EC221C